MGHCLEDSFHAKIPLKNDSTRSIHSVSSHWNYLRQGLYYSIMWYQVPPWLKMNYPDRNYVFQQDRTPAHTSDHIQKFCQKNLSNFWPKNVWPPSSPDLNPLDYFWWGVIEQKVNESPHSNLESLKAKIVSKWAAYLARDIKACASFRKRIETVIAADGLHIEK